MDFNNTTSIFYDTYIEDQRSTYQIVIASLFLLVMMFFGLLGNTAVIAVVWKNRSMREDCSNLLIVNLCTTDLGNSLFTMSSSFLVLVMDKWVLGKFWCDAVCAINYCLIIVSMLTLCCISLDRYQAVLHPLTYSVKVTHKHMLAVIVYTWVQGFTFGLAPSVVGWVAFDYWEAVCAIQWHQNKPDSIIYVALAFLLCFLIPGIILVYCYVKILKEVNKQKMSVKVSSVRDNKANEKSKRKVSERSKMVWSLLIVVLAYFICTTPFSVTKLIKVIVYDKNFIPGPINLTASLLGYIASAINPLIYGIFRRDFRTAYIRLLYSCVGKKYSRKDNSSWSGYAQTSNANLVSNNLTEQIIGCMNELDVTANEAEVTTISKPTIQTYDNIQENDTVSKCNGNSENHDNSETNELKDEQLITQQRSTSLVSCKQINVKSVENGS